MYIIQKCLPLLLCTLHAWAVPHGQRPISREISEAASTLQQEHHGLMRTERNLTDHADGQRSFEVTAKGAEDLLVAEAPDAESIDESIGALEGAAVDKEIELSRSGMMGKLASLRLKFNNWVSRARAPSPGGGESADAIDYDADDDLYGDDPDKKRQGPFALPKVPNQKHLGMCAAALVACLCFAFVYNTQVVDAIPLMQDASPGIKAPDVKIGFFACFGDIHTALHIVFCLFPRNAHTWHTARLMSYWPAMLMQICCPCLMCFWSVYFKGQLKEKLNAEDNAMTDCLPYCCGCCWCADGQSAMLVDEKANARVSCCLKVELFEQGGREQGVLEQ